MILPIRGKMVGAPWHGTLNFFNSICTLYTRWFKVTFLSPSWRSRFAFERVTISPILTIPKRVTFAESPGIVGIYWDSIPLKKKTTPKGGFFSSGKGSHHPSEGKLDLVTFHKRSWEPVFFPKEWFLREPQHTPVSHTLRGLPKPPNVNGIPKHELLVLGSGVCSRGMLENS